MTFLTRFERWDPFDELSTLRNRMDRLVSRMSEGEEGLFKGGWMPTTAVVETGVRSNTAAVSVTSRPSPRLSVIVSPGFDGVSAEKSSAAMMSDAGRPLIAMMRSPRATPASAAGDFGSM